MTASGSDQDFVLAEFLPYRLSVVSAQISQAFERRYSEAAGLSLAEWRVLAHLAQSGEVSVREIEARVGLEKSRVSRAAARLHEQGLLSKQTNLEDRRLVSLALTESGWALMARLKPLAVKFQSEVLEALGPLSAPFSSALTQLHKVEL